MRICKNCPQVLSKLNTNELCFPCQKAQRDRLLKQIPDHIMAAPEMREAQKQARAAIERRIAQHRQRRERLKDDLKSFNCLLSVQDKQDLREWAGEYQMSQGALVSEMIKSHRRKREKKAA